MHSRILRTLLGERWPERRSPGQSLGEPPDIRCRSPMESAPACRSSRPTGWLGVGANREGHPDAANVYQMWVAPTHRGQCAGRLLLEAIIAWASGAGARRVLLSVTCGESASEGAVCAGRIHANRRAARPSAGRGIFWRSRCRCCFLTKQANRASHLPPVSTLLLPAEPFRY